MSTVTLDLEVPDRSRCSMTSKACLRNSGTGERRGEQVTDVVHEMIETADLGYVRRFVSVSDVKDAGRAMTLTVFGGSV